MSGWAERRARLMIQLASRSSRNRSLLDRLCRKLVDRATRLAPEDDFMRDPLIDEGISFDPEELERYERGGTAPENDHTI